MIKRFVVSLNKLINLSLHILIIVIGLILSPITYLIPRKKNLWVFGSANGRAFAENSKHLFLYVAIRHPEIKAVWLSRNPSVIRELRLNGYQAHYTYGLWGYFLSLIARTVFLSGGILDVNPLTGLGARKVQLWHGIATKKVEHDIELSRMKSFKRKGLLGRAYDYLLLRCFLRENDNVNAVIACSEEHKQKMVSAFKIAPSNVYITGYPRNDALFSDKPLWADDSRYLADISGKIKCKRLFMYLPTFRDTKKGSFDLFARYGFDDAEVNQALEKLDAVLIIKTHPNDNCIKPGENAPRILFPSREEISDVYPLLNKTDVLITDYSSVYLDFLLLNRPVIFAPFDLDEYLSNDRELYYNYDEITPGPKAKNWPQVLELLKQESSHDSYAEQRAVTRRMFHKYVDSESSERVYQTAMSILSKH